MTWSTHPLTASRYESRGTRGTSRSRPSGRWRRGGRPGPPGGRSPGRPTRPSFTNTSSSVCFFSTRCRSFSPCSRSRPSTGSIACPSGRSPPRTGRRPCRPGSRAWRPPRPGTPGPAASPITNRPSCRVRSATVPCRTSSPLVQDRHPVGDHLDLAEQVRVDEDRPPLALELQEQVADLLAADRVHAVGRLVQEDHLRVVEERLGDPQPLLHPLGVGADLGVHPLAQADDLQRLGDPLASARPGSGRRAGRRSRAGCGRCGTRGTGGPPAGSRPACGRRWCRPGSRAGTRPRRSCGRCRAGS